MPIQIIIPDNNIWLPVHDGDPNVRTVFNRHYSRQNNQTLFIGPGSKLVLRTFDCKAIFAWRLQLFRGDQQTGIECCIFRNESDHLSSTLILEAEKLAESKWGKRRYVTFVDRNAVRSTNPGYCFKMAGWQVCGESKIKKLLILEKQ